MGHINLLCCDACGKIGIFDKDYFEVRTEEAVVGVYNREQAVERSVREVKPILCAACARPLIDLLNKIVRQAADGSRDQAVGEAIGATGRPPGET